MWARVRSFLRAAGRRRQFEDGLREELRFHLETYARDLEREGLSPREARRRARVQFGSIERVSDDCRSARGLRWLDDLRRDLRLGGRMLARRPGFTAIAVLSLAIGIGANTAIFTLVNTIILRADLELVDRPEELLDIFVRSPEADAFAEAEPVPYRRFEDLRDGTTDVFTGFAMSTFFPVRVDGAQGIEGVFAELVTGDYFRTIGIDALLGRTIRPDDDRPGGARPVVMLNYTYWQRRFGGDPAVVGREIRIGGRAYTVIGVAPAEYPGSGRWIEVALYAPAELADTMSGFELLDATGGTTWWGKGRLAPGVTRARAAVAAAAVARDIDRRRPAGWNVGSDFRLIPTTEVLFTPVLDPYFRNAARLLMGVVGLVLLLSCTNLAGFLLARARDRRRDVSIRLALGASRGALVRQLLAETTLLGLLGGVAGLGLATVLLRALVTADLPLPIPVALYVDLDLDATVLLFTTGLSLLAGTALGLVPALQTTRPDVAGTLRDESSGGGQPGQARWRHALVVAQLTVSLVLMVGAGLFLRNFQQLLATDPGFGREPAALLAAQFPPDQYTTEGARAAIRRVLERFRTLPGVEAAAVTGRMPLDLMDGGSTAFTVDGHEPPADREAFEAEWLAVGPRFFETAGVPILRGRAFRETDGPDGRRVAIVSDTLARRFWPDGDAVGRVLRDPDPGDEDLHIVGVARGILVSATDDAPPLTIYEPIARRDERSVTFIVRTGTHPEQVASALVETGREVEPELFVRDTKTMAEHLQGSRLAAELAAFLFSAFAVLALILSVVGLYGVVRHAVASRTREVGIRMALGATSSSVARLLTRAGVRLVVLGSVLGLSLSLASVRVLDGVLFGIDTLDPVPFVVAPLVLLVTAVVASYLPARRASRTDPVQALHVD